MYRNEAFGFEYEDRDADMDPGYNIWYYNIKFYQGFGNVKKYQKFNSGYINIHDGIFTLINSDDNTTTINFFAVPSSK